MFAAIEEFLRENAEWLFSGIGIALLSLLSPFVLSRRRVRLPCFRVLRGILAPRQLPEAGQATAESLAKLISKLSSVSREVDAGVRELSREIQERESALEALIRRNRELSEQEQDLKKRVGALKDVPIEVGRYFREITEQQLLHHSRRNAKRDVTMFVLGVVVTTVVSVVVTLAFK